MKIRFQIGIHLKTLLKAKGRISFRGSFYLVKGKAFKTGGEIQILKNASRNLIHIPLTICEKDFEKIFQKDLQKQNKWCKSGPKCQIKESNPFISSKIINWFNSK
jgi:hypothetical protein